VTSTSKHWDAVFLEKTDATLGWYEQNPIKTLHLLSRIKNWQAATIFLSGVGTSTLVGRLADENTSLILNDISAEALNSVKKRLGDKLKESVWLCQDIAQPIEVVIPPIDIWIDRAVLHFLIDEKSIQRYFDNLKTHLKKGGYAIFAEFSQTGAEKCAELPIHHYSVDELSMRLGEAFKCKEHFDFIYINPRGDERPYCYALFQSIR
jgi:SAM-dependent methyltransferase